MLGINIIFAGFTLTLNGVSYFVNVDNKAKGIANLITGFIIGFNAVIQTTGATDHVGFAIAAAMWLFSVNYLIIGAHTLLGCENWKVFGLYSLFASITSFVFAGEVIVVGAPLVLTYLWGMWGLLWLQSFLAIFLGIKIVDKYTPHILIINGIASTFVPGLLILLGVIL